VCYLEATNEFIFWEFHVTYIILIVADLKCMLEKKLEWIAIRRTRLV
jgi:hypothetical protein